MSDCHCASVHTPLRVVLTGGPGAGKTAVLEMIRNTMCPHVHVLPESAGIVFRGGFPRGTTTELRRCAQRAIFHVQRELEATGRGASHALVICDRGTIDGISYWPGPDDMLESLGSSLSDELARYHAVIHLRTPASSQGYNHVNPIRIENIDSPSCARVPPDRVAFRVPATPSPPRHDPRRRERTPCACSKHPAQGFRAGRESVHHPIRADGSSLPVAWPEKCSAVDTTLATQCALTQKNLLRDDPCVVPCCP